MIPYGKQDISEDDIKSVIKVLRSDFLTQGKQVPFFEGSIKDYCNVNYSTAFNSATSALHASCLALGLTKGDILWTSPISFVASANCGIYCGAKVDFVDINPNTYNICVEELENKLIVSKKLDKLPKILVAVHLAGQSCDMKRIRELSKEYNFYVIEDASHALGAIYLKNIVGSCKYSDITIFSFHPVKMITTGEGGIATTNSTQIDKKLKLIRTHGITKNQNEFESSSKGKWFYEQQILGFNFRMNDIEAALGISQLKRLKDFLDKRNNIAKKYFENLSDLPIKLPTISKFNYCSYHLYVIRVNNDPDKDLRNKLFDYFRENNIFCNIHYIPIHFQPFFKKFGFKRGDFPSAEKYYEEAISLPIYSKLKVDEQNYIIKKLSDFFK